MKFGNKKQAIYTKQLKTELIKQGGTSEEEANIAAKELTKVLLANGDSLDLKTVKNMARLVMEQKQRFDKEELVSVDGKGVYDTIIRILTKYFPEYINF